MLIQLLKFVNQLYVPPDIILKNPLIYALKIACFNTSMIRIKHVFQAALKPMII